MTRFMLFAAALMLSSCASIPLGTMLEFRSFNKEDFFNIHPQDIRVKILLDEPVKAKIGTEKLAVKITTEKGASEFQFPLLLLGEKNIAPVEGLFSDTPGKTEYTLKLSDEALKSFIATQRIVQNEQTGTLNFSVQTGFEPLPAGLTEIQLSIFLKLSEERGFVTLFDNATLEITHQG